jgi:hypothetical protein
MAGTKTKWADLAFAPSPPFLTHYLHLFIRYPHHNRLIVHPQLLVRATNERFLSREGTFKVGSCSQIEPLVAIGVGTHCPLVTHTNKCGWVVSPLRAIFYYSHQ